MTEERSTAVAWARVRILLVLCAVAACAVSAGTARAAPGQAYEYDRLLGIVARTSLWQAASQDAPISMRKVLRVYVRCYRDRGSFDRTFERRFGESATRVVAYYVGGGDLHLRNGTCENIRMFLGGRHTVYTAGAYAILLHEALHRQSVRSERITTCLANDAVRWGTLWHGFGEAKALRARNLAFAYTRLFSPPGYYMGKPDCLTLTRRKDWQAFT
jgi:hypothetical protein